MRYSPPPIDERTLVIGVSQSGETADTLAPIKMAAERGATVVVVTNVVGSAITREADAVCYLQAGPEIAVASTKAFVTQVLVLQMLALQLARMRGTLSESRLRTFGRAQAGELTDRHLVTPPRRRSSLPSRFGRRACRSVRPCGRT